MSNTKLRMLRILMILSIISIATGSLMIYWIAGANPSGIENYKIKTKYAEDARE